MATLKTPSLLAILALTVLIYAQTLGFDFVNWDDDYYVLNNPQVTQPSWQSIRLFFVQGNTANYHPMTMLSLTLNYWFGQENAMGYHLINLVFHLFNTVLLFSWVKNMWPSATYLPLWVAGVFALHPMHVESVAWISSRKDVLFFFFYFVGLHAYFIYLRSNQNKWYWWTLVAFIFSGLSKPTAVIFPIHLLLVDYVRLRVFEWKNLWAKIPFFLVSIVLGLATVLVQNDAGAVSTEFYSFIERIQLGSYAINLYLLKFFAPFELSSFYPYPRLPFKAWVTTAPIILMALLGGLGWKFKANKNIIFGLLFFLVSLALLIQLVTVGSTIISERYTYLAYVGWSISVYFILVEFVPITQQKGVFWWFPLVVFTLLSFNRIKVWKNGETLWSDAIQKFPEVAGSWGGRGVFYRIEKRYDLALADFNEAIRLNPNEAMFYSNRGNIYFDLGQEHAAFNDYNTCLSLDPSDENAFANRGALYGRKGEFSKALEDLNTAILLNPSFANAYKNRGLIFGQLNERNKAKQDYHHYLQFKPRDHEVKNALAIEHQYLSEFDSSIVVLNEAILLAPQQGIYFLNRGISFRLLGQQQKAISDFNTARQLGTPVNQGYYQPVP